MFWSTLALWTPLFPPKMTEVQLLRTLKETRKVLLDCPDKLADIARRPGRSLQEKVKQSKGGIEKQICNFFYKHGAHATEHSDCVAVMKELDAMVTGCHFDTEGRGLVPDAKSEDTRVAIHSDVSKSQQEECNTPVKRRKCEEATSPLDSSPDSRSNLATTTPLSPVAVLRLAQSCRKSPAYQDTHSTQVIISDTDEADALSLVTSSAIREAADRLLPEVQNKVRKVFEHILDGRALTGNPMFLPKQSAQPTDYRRLYDLRKQACEDPSTLQPQDYELLAYLPHILGPEVFGEVVAHDGGWRWTFQRATLAVESEIFPSEDAAIGALVNIQRQLYPHWYVSS